MRRLCACLSSPPPPSESSESDLGLGARGRDDEEEEEAATEGLLELAPNEVKARCGLDRKYSSAADGGKKLAVAEVDG